MVRGNRGATHAFTGSFKSTTIDMLGWESKRVRRCHCQCQVVSQNECQAEWYFRFDQWPCGKRPLSASVPLALRPVYICVVFHYITLQYYFCYYWFATFTEAHAMATTKSPNENFSMDDFESLLSGLSAEELENINDLVDPEVGGRVPH